MVKKTPHLVQYQGSKRILAPQILKYMPSRFNKLIEPFSGMAAISIAVAKENRAHSFLLNDINRPLISLLEATINKPEELVRKYRSIWEEQFLGEGSEQSINHYYAMRKKFNLGVQTPEMMLYLLARCVKGSVRYGRDGNFNQSPDKRRHGTKPENIAKNAMEISQLLQGRTAFFNLDYREILDSVQPGDIVYMDPPYQGVSYVRDNRYCSGIIYEDFVNSLDALNRRGIDFLVSYDGECGSKTYGESLPFELECTKIMLNAGLSSQMLLLGKKQITHEALYVSKGLGNIAKDKIIKLSFWSETA